MDMVGPTESPEALELVQGFVNTYDVESKTDDLATSAQLRDWLTERGLLIGHGSVTDADLAAALEAREAIRALLVANAGGPEAPAAAESLGRAAARARLVLRFDPAGGATLEPDAPGVDGALGRLLSAIYVAMEEGTWRRLKACRRDTCRWAFYDHSKNRSRSWCAMSVCGNRVKAQTFRERQRSET
jgi:predicted RNA-binding Zn ribbon-like protein